MISELNTTYSDYLKNLGITSFTPMQETVIAKAAEHEDLIVVAPTGTGKTLAFLIALLNNITPGKKGVQALIVVPSRELALQVEQVFKSMKTSYKVSCCYGGHSVRIEQNNLGEAPTLVIGTPGRLADHISRGSFDASSIEMVVLDEFDKSLQMGFHSQLETIFAALNGKQRHLLTSATNFNALPGFLPFKQAETLSYFANEVESKLEQKLVTSNSAEKVDTLLRLVAGFKQEVCLVFCSHRDAVERISALFKLNHFEHGIFHGGMEQIDREKNLIKFRGGAHNVLIATDLASRGLDIPEIKHVVHYQLPLDHEAFIHRNGRTARMKADGISYVIIADDETRPEYISKSLENMKIGEKLVLPPPPAYVCLYFGAGKKEKINKGDIVGLLIKKGELKQDDIGLITTLDHSSYVSVKRSVIHGLLNKIKEEKIKKMRVKIEVAN